MAINDADHRDAAAEENEDTGAPVAPIVRPEEVDFPNGEEDEDVILDLEGKLYRFDHDSDHWKQRGDGSVRLLKHKKTGKVRLVMRQSKTLIVRANHLIQPTMCVNKHNRDDKSCLWHAADFSDGELKDELFGVRFKSVENREKFMKAIEGVVEIQYATNDDGQDTSRVEDGCISWIVHVWHMIMGNVFRFK